jgi:hypothetical protein
MREGFENSFVEKSGSFENFEIIFDYGEKLERPNPEDFSDIYPREEIERDVKKLEEIERKIAESEHINEQRGKAFEVLLVDQIHDGEWMGQEAMITQASRFDDVIKGVDPIVEFDRENAERMAIVVDVSTASDIAVVEKKIRKNIDKLFKGGRFLEVKYFQSQICDSGGTYYKGRLENLIPVVVGADRRNADVLFEIFTELKMHEKRGDSNLKERRKELREILAKHPIQDLFLQETRIQLETYKRILKGKDEEIVKECEKLLSIIEEIIEVKKRNKTYSFEDVPHDETFNNINEVCSLISREEE